jgi:hypothetical protein
MPVKIKKPSMILALSPNGVATSLGIRAEQVYEAIRNGDLVVRKIGTRKRVMISDVSDWIERTWPEAKPKSKRKAVPHG